MRARHYAPEGEKTSINCSVTHEEFTGWFDSSGRKITSDSSQRIHVREDGSLKYLEISTVNRTDRGTYECRGKTNKDQVMLLVECMYHKRGRKLPKFFKALSPVLNTNNVIKLLVHNAGLPWGQRKVVAVEIWGGRGVIWHRFFSWGSKCFYLKNMLSLACNHNHNTSITKQRQMRRGTDQILWTFPTKHGDVWLKYLEKLAFRQCCLHPIKKVFLGQAGAKCTEQ